MIATIITNLIKAEIFFLPKFLNKFIFLTKMTIVTTVKAYYATIGDLTYCFVC